MARFTPVFAAVVLWALTIVVAVRRAQQAIAYPAVGLDLRPLYDAGRAVARGQSVYDVPRFVYPPGAALFWTPFAHLSYHTVVVGTAYAETVSLAVMVAASFRLAMSSPWWLASAAVFCTVLLKSDLIVGLLWLENFSVLLVALVPLLLYLSARRAWVAMAVVLGLSLLLKPLLAGFVVLPLLARRWWLVVYLVLGVVVGSLLALLVTGGASSLPSVARHLLGGSELTGNKAVDNLSLTGFGAVHHVPGALVAVVRVGVVVVAVLCVCLAASASAPSSVPDLVSFAAISTLVLDAVLLAGPLSENHYVIYLVPALIIVGLGRRRWSVAVPLLVAVVALGFSSFYLGFGDSLEAAQVRGVLIEGAVLWGLAASVLPVSAFSSFCRTPPLPSFCAGIDDPPAPVAAGFRPSRRRFGRAGEP